MQAYPDQGKMPPGMAGWQSDGSEQYMMMQQGYGMSAHPDAEHPSKVMFIQQALAETGARSDVETPEGRQMALLEFARENLLLKRELHQVNSEIGRIKELIQAQEHGNAVKSQASSSAQSMPAAKPEQQQQQQQQKQLQLQQQQPATLEADSEASKTQRRYWTDEEHERFLEAIQAFGSKNVKAVSAYVGTRSGTQVRTHAQKYFLKLTRKDKRSAHMGDLSHADGDQMASRQSQHWVQDPSDPSARREAFIFDPCNFSPQVLKAIGNPSAKDASFDDEDQCVSSNEGEDGDLCNTAPPSTSPSSSDSRGTPPQSSQGKGGRKAAQAAMQEQHYPFAYAKPQAQRPKDQRIMMRS